MGLVRKAAVAIAVLAAAGAAAGWMLSAPDPLSEAEIASLPQGDAERGRDVFFAAGCSSCHAAPRATGDDRLLLAGGLRLETGFGTFVAPNISMHEADGIGAWTQGDFANAMLRGVSPSGSHYYPAFPYASYTRMDVQDVTDLHAFMLTLPAVEGAAPGHELGFPFGIRRGIGLWKLAFMDAGPAVDIPDASEAVARGQYLVEGPGHCGECHTPRNLGGGLVNSNWLAGATAAEGEGTVPNITPHEDGLGGWSDFEIVNLLETGFTPDFDSVGGSMAAVVRNLAELPASDREAIAAYLKAIPARPDAY
jgi:mono/diheme cytochrome c family protein